MVQRQKELRAQGIQAVLEKKRSLLDLQEQLEGALPPMGSRLWAVRA
jgi:hypothetical protein